MRIDTIGEETLGTYARAWWAELPSRRRRRYGIGAAVFAAFWLAGALHAPGAVAGLTRLTGLSRFLMALGMGGFSFLWRGLTGAGLIEETPAAPNLLWLLLAFIVPGLLGLVGYLLSQPPNPAFARRKMMARAAAAQGRVEDEALKEALSFRRGVPLVWLGEGEAATLAGVDYDQGEGHVLVAAPTRAGKGLHLTDALRHYPGPALIVDPKGEQWARTAGLRRQVGPVYRVPGHSVHLAGYYRHLRDRDEVIELHYHLLRPWASREPIFAEKAVSLFTAVGLYAAERGGNPVRLLLDLAESNPTQALAALRTVPAARRHVDIFSNGAPPDAYGEDKFVTSALGNFTTRLAPYQKHIDTIAPPDLGRRERIVPPDWAERGGTIYITYTLNELHAAGGVVAAAIAALLRYQMRAADPRRAPKLLAAIDELPAVGLRNIVDYLSTCGGYGVTFLLYIQSVAQLQELYGPAGTRAILANCDHQLWYPAAEIETARVMSELYGTTWKATPSQSLSRSARRHRNREGEVNTQMSQNRGASWSWREGAALSPNAMMGLPPGQALAATRAGRRYVFLGRRLNPIPLFDQLPPPPEGEVPRPSARPRRYTDWQAAAEAKPEQTPAEQKTPPDEARPASGTRGLG